MRGWVYPCNPIRLASFVAFLQRPRTKAGELIVQKTTTNGVLSPSPCASPARRQVPSPVSLFQILDSLIPPRASSEVARICEVLTVPSYAIAFSAGDGQRRVNPINLIADPSERRPLLQAPQPPRHRLHTAFQWTRYRKAQTTGHAVPSTPKCSRQRIRETGSRRTRSLYIGPAAIRASSCGISHGPCRLCKKTSCCQLDCKGGCPF
jgi:hypothetical protein